MIQVLFFARLREQLGVERLELEGAGLGDVTALRHALQQQGDAWAEALADDRRLMAAVNQEMAGPATPIQNGDEVAFFPPVTGG